jgi:DNA-binding transcriptional ArsR family regulator
MKKMTEAKIEICKSDVVNWEKVDSIKQRLPQNSVVTDLAEFFKVVADPTRMRIVLALAEDELCVCDLSAIVGVSVSAISHQLRLLRGMKLVRFRKEGKMVYYSLDDDHVASIVNEAKKHIRE